MKRLLVVTILFFGVLSFAQNQEDILAREYFKNGEFEKALISYEQLVKQKPFNVGYITQLVKTYQQLERYEDAQQLLLLKVDKLKYPAFYVELGYNHQLKNEMDIANDYYNKAISTLDESASYVYSVGQTFVNRSLLDQAAATYKKGMTLNPKFNFNMQLAQIYGEQGDIEKMFANYMDFAQFNPNYLSRIKRAISDFINEDALNENNIILKRILLQKIQKEPNLLWNEMLSWLFIQQKDFNKSFMQEKAIFNRQPESLDRIEELANIALNDNETTVAKTIFNYIINSAQETERILNAHYHLLQIETKLSSTEAYDAISNKYLELFDQFGRFTQTLKLQIAYAHFLAFYKNETRLATSFLKQTLELQLTAFQEAQVKLELGDILVLQEKFNEALIYYTQIQRKLKNSTVSQQARFKVAKTSYYKGDFKWAESQLKY